MIQFHNLKELIRIIKIKINKKFNRNLIIEGLKKVQLNLGLNKIKRRNNLKFYKKDLYSKILIFILELKTKMN
jgi:hypothetical protein